MTALQLRITRRAIKTRLNSGESFETIIADYSLTADEISETKTELGIVDETAEAEG